MFLGEYLGNNGKYEKMFSTKVLWFWKHFI